MDNDNKAVNAGKDASGDAGNKSATASDAKIAELQARLEKETKEKEIYKSGLLAAKELAKGAKRVTAETLEDPAKLDEAIDAKIRGRELEKKVSEASPEAVESADERVRKLEEQNAELMRSLEAAKTSGGFGGSAGAGSGRSEVESKPAGYWSDAQRDELRGIYRSRGFYSEKQIETMVAKAEEIARNKLAQSARGNDLVKTRSY